MNPDDWDFWVDEAKLPCVGYSSDEDLNALNVLKGIAAGKFSTDIAAELQLPSAYVETLQGIFCSIGWANYGTSPRGCWLEKDGAVPKMEAWFARKWDDTVG